MSDMDPKRSAYDLKAPGRSGSGMPQRLPGRGPFPRVDDHLVVPEITRDEIIGGRRVIASPAHPPHATQHTRLDYVIQAHVASGYTVAADLLTRHDQDSDFASDVCVFKDGIDPSTGARHREREAAARARGHAEGIAESVLQILETRGITVSSEQKQEILGCSDPARLNRWLLKAVSAPTVEEVTSGP